MSQFYPISEQELSGHCLVIRSDLNVPMQDGAISDASRIERFATGLRPLLEQGARAVILSHMGRPGGKPDPKLSLEPVAAGLAAALERPVRFAGPIGSANEIARNMRDGEAILCENLRFDPREEANDQGFATEMAALGELYVNDAFSCSHRAHASIDALARLFAPAYAGPLLLEEVGALQSALERPEKPAMAVVGGAKVSSKLAVLRNLVSRLDSLIIGGGMANTFLLADGIPIGASLSEPDMIDMVAEIRVLAREAKCEIITPLDIVYGSAFSPDAKAVTAALHDCPDDAMILDVGAASLDHFCRKAEQARTLLWNGPLGAFELPAFANGTIRLARHAANLTRSGQLTSIAGGGDTLAALNQAGATDGFSYVSTAGGAFLEWIEGRELPGIAALTK